MSKLSYFYNGYLKYTFRECHLRIFEEGLESMSSFFVENNGAVERVYFLFAERTFFMLKAHL